MAQARGNFLGILAVVVSSSLSAATITVELNGGGDHTSIQAALDAAGDGDTIVVFPGIYFENIHFQGKNVTLRSADPASPVSVAATVIDGSDAGSVVAFSGSEDETCVLEGLTITHGAAALGGGIHGNDTRATIRGNRIHGNRTICGWPAEGAGLYGCQGTIRGNTILGNSSCYIGGGLASCGGLIQGNFIIGNSAQDYGGALARCNGLIENNVIARNESYDCAGGLYECTATIQGNTIVGNRTDNHGHNLGWCTGPITNCIIWGGVGLDGGVSVCSVPSFSCIQGWTGGGEGNIDADPLFLDLDAGDYRLQVGSPCMDAGTTEGAAATDIEGNPRLCGSGVDIGAYEYCGPATRLWLSEDDSGSLRVVALSDLACTAFSFGLRLMGSCGSAAIKRVWPGADLLAVKSPEFFASFIAEDGKSIVLGCVLSIEEPFASLPPGRTLEVVRLDLCGTVPESADCSAVFAADVGARGSPIVIVDAKGQGHSPARGDLRLPPGPRPCFLRGDANSDGTMDIADPIRVLVLLFLDPTPLDCQDAADANDDGAVDLSDPIFLLSYQFLEGDEIPAPFLPAPWPRDLTQGCGQDPTSDELTCGAYPACR